MRRPYLRASLLAFWLAGAALFLIPALCALAQGAVYNPPAAAIGAAGSPSSSVVSVQGASGMTPLAVYLSTQPNVNLYGLGGNEATIDSTGNLWTRPGFQEYANLSAAATNADLLPSTDVSAYRSWSIEIIGTFVGTVTWQCSNDNANWTGATACSSVDTSSILRNNIASTASLSSIYTGAVTYRYLRIRMTSWTSGTATGTVELNTYPYVPQSIGAAVSNAPSVYPASNTTGGATPFYLSGLGALSTIKASAGQLYTLTISNTQSSTAAFVQLFNAATTSAVTLGTTMPVQELYLAGGSTQSVSIPDVGIAFSSGIVIASTTADRGAAASASGVIVSGAYK